MKLEVTSRTKYTKGGPASSAGASMSIGLMTASMFADIVGGEGITGLMNALFNSPTTRMREKETGVKKGGDDPRAEITTSGDNLYLC